MCTPLNGKKRTKNAKNSKFNISQIILTTLVETLSRSMPEFWGVKLLCVLSEEMCFEFFSPYGPMLTKTNKKPRGLDALLGHLLDKRISVWYKLTTIVAVQISLKI